MHGGNQTVWATLTGYQTTVLPLTIAGNVAGQNLVLRRLAPVAPTTLTANVSAGSVGLNWDDSPDLLVDGYKVYAKLTTETIYTLRATVPGRLNSLYTDALTTPGAYHYVVTAYDDGVIAPALESAYSNRLDVMIGALSPKSLYARSDYDDHVHLTWAGPTEEPLVEMSYDNGMNSMAVGGIGFPTQPTFGWYATKFHVTGAVKVHRVRVYFTSRATIGDPFQVALFAENGTTGRPTTLPLNTISATMAAPLDTYREFYFEPPVTFPTGTFFVGVKQSTANRLAIGGDVTTAFVNNTFYSAQTQFSWDSFESTSTLAIPMIRAIAQTVIGVEELAALPVSDPWEPALSRPPLSKTEQAAFDRDRIPVYLTDEALATESQFVDARLSTAVDAREPFMETVQDHHGGSTLDALDYYIVYRNGEDVAHPTVTVYDDFVAEGLPLQLLCEGAFRQRRHVGPFEHGDDDAGDGAGRADRPGGRRHHQRDGHGSDADVGGSAGQRGQLDVHGPDAAADLPQRNAARLGGPRRADVHRQPPAVRRRDLHVVGARSGRSPQRGPGGDDRRLGGSAVAGRDDRLGGHLRRQAPTRV